MSGLTDLYQEVILDHHKRPRNYGPLPTASQSAKGANPLCGDRVTVHLALEGGRVEDIRFEGVGCAISTASASLMSEAVKGRSLEEIDGLFTDFRRLLTDDSGVAPGAEERLGKLRVFSGVREFPVRVKCATLAWHTLQAALAADARPVTTE